MDRIFANVIIYFRQKFGLSQKIVSIKTGIAQSELSKLEEWTHWPNRKTIAKFCNGLGISGKEFLLRMGINLIITALTIEIWLDDEEEAMKKNEVIRRNLDKLRREMGDTIRNAMDDNKVIEIMLNPDGKVWTGKIGAGMELLRSVK